MNHQEYLEVAVAACREAAEIQMQGLKKERNIDFKGSINLVTDIDHACEEKIITKIQGTFPEHDVLAEEGRGERKNSDFKWIIDPLDGTTNYAHAYPLFATSIALEYCGEIIVAAVYEPNLDELFTAIKGEGAHLNNELIRVSNTDDLGHSLLATGFSYNFKEAERDNLDDFANFLKQSRAVRRDGVAAVDLCYVACGRYDGFWELELYPWDVAAGRLIVEEAGGRVTNYRGDCFSVYDKEVLATNAKIHKQMLDVL